MSFFSSLFNKIWSNTSNPSLVQLPSGSLYIKSNTTSTSECIFNDCIAEIRRTSIPFAYQLVITRAYQEGEEPDNEDDNLELDDEKVFLIDVGLEFRAQESEDAHSFVWRDLDGSEEELLEFRCDEKLVNKVTREVFERAFLQCAYERKFERSHEEAGEKDLERLRWKADGTNIYPSTPASAPRSTSEELSSQLDNLSVSASHSKGKGKEKSKSKSTNPTKVPAENFSAEPKAAPTSVLVPSLPNDEEPQVKLQAVGDLYLYDQGNGLFMSQEKGVEARVLEAGRFLYWLSISSTENGRTWLSQQLSTSMNLSFSRESLSAVWNYFDEEGHCYSWLLRFDELEKYSEFMEGVTRLMWEGMNEEKWVEGKNAKPADQRYLQQAYEEDSEMMELDPQEEEELTEEELKAIEEVETADAAAKQQKTKPKSRKSKGKKKSKKENAYLLNDVVEESEEEEEVANELGLGSDDEVNHSLRYEEESEEEEEEIDPNQSRQMPGERGDVNSHLAVGYNKDRSFVVRGERIGVFKHTEDDKLEFETTIEGVKGKGGKKFKPSKIMLHDQDSTMILADPSNTSSLFKMDLEYGKIVDEWSINPDIAVNTFLPSTKYSQMTSEQTLVGTSHNSIFRIDPRLSGNKLVDEQFKQYVSKNKFNSSATDGKGRLAIGSEKGDIRLFDTIGKNAKTVLPALGDPILGVDVTADGRYIVATCKTYLLVIDTLIGDGRYKGSLGFDRSFPAEAKPIPRRLQLKAHHVAYMGQEVSFTPARFNVGDNDETSIVTSSGPFVVTFDLNKVKRGNLSAYSLVKLADTVVQDQYGYGSEGKRIVVAMASDVQMTKKNQLKKPTRESLTATPKGSRSSIVDERY